MLYGLLLGETTTFPIGSSAGGFTWTFDSNLRVPIRRSMSFGPMFTDRPFTTGRGKLNVGMGLSAHEICVCRRAAADGSREVFHLPQVPAIYRYMVLGPGRDRSDHRERHLRYPRPGGRRRDRPRWAGLVFGVQFPLSA